ncbi:hypothetical protein LQ757_00190 [Agromyces sp. SYSU K20354]|uniref:hypothetical protein n=1 Tax=Agromyces cavernae TaxID=2898659 RepID=UPI001E377633|nr:hypothetical protein [Agromyces cavernae]MCD2440687.1 hypothetical protein [Agromyces cavernae]
MNAATPHRVKLILLVAVLAALVIAGLVLESGRLERLMALLPGDPGPDAAIGVIAAVALGCAVWALVRMGHAARARSRRRALEASVRGDVSSGIRTRMLVARLNELRVSERHEIKLAARYSIVADELGVAFWNGGRRPQRAMHFPWREVRNIRADSMIVGGAVVSVLVLRVRRGGTSVELPIILGASRAGSYALSDAPFFAVVRSWKSMHRDALKAEGIEPPPITGAIPIIRTGQAYAAVR